MLKNKTYGGFFELVTENPSNPPGYTLPMHSGRASLAAILQYLAPDIVHVPDLCCPVILHTLTNMGIEFRIAEVTRDTMLPKFSFAGGCKEIGIVIPYYFISDNSDYHIADALGDRIIMDNTQVVGSRTYENTFSFNSLRKWLGVPDGSLLCVPDSADKEFWSNKRLIPNDTLRTAHLVPDSSGNKQYDWYQLNELRISDNPNARMSHFTENIMDNHTDFTRIYDTRMRNFINLHSLLVNYNSFFDKSTYSSGIRLSSAPFCYPFLPKKPIDRSKLWAKNIYVPQYWKDSPCENDSFAHTLSEQLLPLPIDQRYDDRDMETIAQEVMGLVRRA